MQALTRFFGVEPGKFNTGDELEPFYQDKSTTSIVLHFFVKGIKFFSRAEPPLPKPLALNQSSFKALNPPKAQDPKDPKPPK